MSLGIRSLQSINASLMAVFICACPPLHAQERPQGEFRIGAQLLGANKPGCPIFIGHVTKDSPAAKAGLKAGDRLLKVDGRPVANVMEAARLVSSTTPDPIELEIATLNGYHSVSVQREDTNNLWRREGWKVLPDGMMAKADATESEIQYQKRVVHVVEDSAEPFPVAFPDQHYPLDKKTYYPGFEVFILKRGDLVVVGGIEDGPASNAGVRYGDEILAINNIDPRHKSVAEIEAALSSKKPASTTLTIARGGPPLTFSFNLEKASAVLHNNEKKEVNGKIVPLWLTDEYLSCWN